VRAGPAGAAASHKDWDARYSSGIPG